MATSATCDSSSTDTRTSDVPSGTSAIPVPKKLNSVVALFESNIDKNAAIGGVCSRSFLTTSALGRDDKPQAARRRVALPVHKASSGNNRELSSSLHNPVLQTSIAGGTDGRSNRELSSSMQNPISRSAPAVTTHQKNSSSNQELSLSLHNPIPARAALNCRLWSTSSHGSSHREKQTSATAANRELSSSLHNPVSRAYNPSNITLSSSLHGPLRAQRNGKSALGHSVEKSRCLEQSSTENDDAAAAAFVVTDLGYNASYEDQRRLAMIRASSNRSLSSVGSTGVNMASRKALFEKPVAVATAPSLKTTAALPALHVNTVNSAEGREADRADNEAAETAAFVVSDVGYNASYEDQRRLAMIRASSNRSLNSVGSTGVNMANRKALFDSASPKTTAIQSSRVTPAHGSYLESKTTPFVQDVHESSTEDWSTLREQMIQVMASNSTRSAARRQGSGGDNDDDSTLDETEFESDDDTSAASFGQDDEKPQVEETKPVCESFLLAKAEAPTEPPAKAADIGDASEASLGDFVEPALPASSARSPRRSRVKDRASSPTKKPMSDFHDSTDNMHGDQFLASFEEQRKLALRRGAPKRTTSKSLDQAASLADRMKAFQQANK